jgi:tetratricopeptide (TPR) repeat protein
VLVHATLLALVAVFGARAFGATADEDIATATSLFSAGRVDEAEALVTELRKLDPAPLQVLFLSGAIALSRGKYDVAADEFRRMLARDPTLLRPRLELARALYLAGEYQTARYHFEQVLSAPLPDAVRQNVLAYLVQIRERVPSLLLGLDVLYDSNPKQATSAQFIEIGGLLFRVADPSRAQSGTGLLVTGYGRLPLPSDPNWFATAYAEWFDFSGRDMDSSYLQVLGGRRINLGRHSVELQAGGHYASYRGDDLYTGPNARVSDFVRLLPNLSLNLSLDARELDYRQFEYLSGWQYVASAELYAALAPARSLRGGLSWIRGDAAEAPYAFEGPAVFARFVQEWRGGWIGTAFARYSHLRFDAADPFFAVARDDEEWRAELSLMNRKLQYRGFAPRLTLGWVDHASNIPIYAFERAYVRMGVTREF